MGITVRRTCPYFLYENFMLADVGYNFFRHAREKRYARMPFPCFIQSFASRTAAAKNSLFVLCQRHPASRVFFLEFGPIGSHNGRETGVRENGMLARPIPSDAVP